MPQVLTAKSRHGSWMYLAILVAMCLAFAATLVGLSLWHDRTTTVTHAASTIGSATIPDTAPLANVVKQPADHSLIPKPAAAADCGTPNAHSDPSRIDVIVNKKHCMSPRGYEPTDLVTRYGATLRLEAAEAFVRMSDAAAAVGLPLRVTSSYRSYQNQVYTYNHWVAVNGSAAAADRVSARPGYSEHQTGLALDLAAGDCALECFGTTRQSAWLVANAADYGFVIRYPSGHEATTGYSPEPWHYRYIGIAAARDMTSRGAATLEDYWGISGGDY